jgi:hypothetical protein
LDEVIAPVEGEEDPQTCFTTYIFHLSAGLTSDAEVRRGKEAGM